MMNVDITCKGAVVTVDGTPEVILSDLTLAIRKARNFLKETIPHLDTDDLVREAIRMGMMSDEDFENVLDDQRKKILREE